MKQKQFSITNVILGLSIFILVLLVLFSLPDHRRRRFNKMVMLKANLKALALGARYVMQEEDTNEVTYHDIVEENALAFLPESIFGEDYTTFDVNTNDTTVGIQIPDGNFISIEFNP
jgi:hypothetical protein